MKPVTIVTPYSAGPVFEKTVLDIAKSDTVEDVIIVCPEDMHINLPGRCIPGAGPLLSEETLESVIGNIHTEYMFLLPEPVQISIESYALKIFLETALSTKAGIIYADYYDENRQGRQLHPLNDYLSGSVRDDFDFGSGMLFSVSALENTLEKYGGIPDVKYAGLYFLRLMVSIDNAVHHIREPLYTVREKEELSGVEKIFFYVDPGNIAVQKEMEIVFTEYLKRIDAYLPPRCFKEDQQRSSSFPTEVSVIIPVRNRKATIADAVKSALSQEAAFPFNVLVVDNHSTDGTTAVLAGMSAQYAALHHIIPARNDLGIGGCWNEAIYSGQCGRYAVQLDSDDLYSSPHTLEKIVHMFREGKYAMVIGSYSIVDFDLQEIPPGLIDHREWTANNGHNNALRINGFGAPRAFDTDIIRNTGFLNVSYGEDYAAALRICREYPIGRIYESLYLCRRWMGNTDASLSIVDANRNNAFKDRIRTEEILSRQQMNRGNKC